ncbi:MAG TPA: hypothetical protein VFL57_13230 [Bryobacteraceae bacterium]|nr:hypothetical protein [Bryobacteraceae bacterium]
MYEPERRQFSWDNPEMRILYRILDWAEKRGVDVFLQQMWSNVEWNALPELRGSPEGVLRSMPLSLDDFAYGLGELVHHLTVTRGYRSIKWLAINNEPGHGFSWWQNAKLLPESITPGLAAVRRELDRRGIRLPLSGPDWTDLPDLDPARIDFDEYIGAYDIHSYNANFNGLFFGYPLHEAERRLERWARWAHARNKPLFLSELGTQFYGFREDDPGPGTYEAVIKDAALVVRGIRAGVDAFNRWSFVNRGDLDGQWQLVDTWDIDRERLRASFSPHANSYYGYGLLTRFTSGNSKVLATDVSPKLTPVQRDLVAATLRSPAGRFTILAVNESHRDAGANFRVTGLDAATALYRYAFTPAGRDRADVVIRPARTILIGPRKAEFRETIPAMSIVVYSNITG